VDSIVLSLAVPNWDTSASFPYEAHKATIGGCPVGPVTINVKGKDYRNRVLYAGEIETTALAGILLKPTIEMVLTNPLFITYIRVDTVGSNKLSLPISIISNYSIQFFMVNGDAVALNDNGSSGTVEINLIEGENTIFFQALNEAGNVENDTLRVFYDPGFVDNKGPIIKLINPTGDSTEVDVQTLTVSINATDASGISSVTVNGQPASISGTNWQAVIQLQSGPNIIMVEATDKSVSQNVSNYEFTVIYNTPTSDSSTVDSSLFIGFAPNQIETIKGQTFKVDLVAISVDSLFGFSYEILFNSNLLSVSEKDFTLGPFMGNEVISIFVVDTDTLSIGITRKAGNVSVTGSGVLATLNFLAKNTGIDTLKILDQNFTMRNSNDNDINNLANIKKGSLTIIVK